MVTAVYAPDLSVSVSLRMVEILATVELLYFLLAAITLYDDALLRYFSHGTSSALLNLPPVGIHLYHDGRDLLLSSRCKHFSLKRLKRCHVFSSFRQEVVTYLSRLGSSVFALTS